MVTIVVPFFRRLVFQKSHYLIQTRINYPVPGKSIFRQTVLSTNLSHDYGIIMTSFSGKKVEQTQHGVLKDINIPTHKICYRAAI